VQKKNTEKEEKWMKNSYFNVQLIIKKKEKRKKIVNKPTKRKIRRKIKKRQQTLGWEEKKKKEEDEAFCMIRSFNLVLPTELLMVILFVKSNGNF